MIDILPEIRTFAYTFIIASLAYFLLWKRRKSPPGPYGLPIVGYYPFLGKDPIDTIHQLSKKYGDVMCINLLGEDYWILNSYEAIEEALVTKGEIFAGRPSDEFNFLGIFGENTIAIWEGEQWRIPQKFVLSHLAQLGMGKSEFDLRMHGIFDSVEKYVDDHCGEPHDYSVIINEFTINTITALVCSKQYSYTDPTFMHIRKLLQNVFSSMEYFNMLLSGNIFKYYMKFTTQADVKLRNNFGEFRDYVSSLLKEREATFDENNCRDLLDYWLKESRKPNSKYITYDNLAANVADLLMAGSDTTATVIYSGLYLMAEHPEVQRRVYEEISDTIGTDGLFYYLDRERMQYTQAVIAEVQRCNIIAPLANLHASRQETTLMGFVVPKRQKILPNVFALTKDKNHFPNPDNFDPNNFLDENGNYKSNKALIPFGVGVRKCMGYKFSEIEIFVSLVRLIRKFEWSFPDNRDLIGFTTTEGNARFLKSLTIVANKRQ